jgi:hypothetical protein
MSRSLKKYLLATRIHHSPRAFNSWSFVIFVLLHRSCDRWGCLRAMLMTLKCFSVHSEIYSSSSLIYPDERGYRTNRQASEAIRRMVRQCSSRRAKKRTIPNIRNCHIPPKNGWRNRDYESSSHRRTNRFDWHFRLWRGWFTSSQRLGNILSWRIQSFARSVSTNQPWKRAKLSFSFPSPDGAPLPIHSTSLVNLLDIDGEDLTYFLRHARRFPITSLQLRSTIHHSLHTKQISQYLSSIIAQPTLLRLPLLCHDLCEWIDRSR